MATPANDHAGPVHAASPGIAGPAVPGEQGASLLAIQNELERSQWLRADELERRQLEQLQLTLRHAWENVPFYRERLAAAGYDPGRGLSREAYFALPLMTREDIRACGEAMLARGVPAGHGRVTTGETSGSTGTPIRYYGTELTQFFWNAFALRDHGWHRRDLTAKLAAIRRNLGDDLLPSWGPPADLVARTGSCATLGIGNDLDAQLAWLKHHAPAYLITNAHNLYWLARRSIELGIRLPGLRQVRSFGGSFPEDARAVIRRAWNVPLADIYTAEEVGYIALQCPDHDQYHVQSENLIVEVLDEAGKPCPPGGIGKVVLTTLHNFAMPLLRYDIGDYAEAGAACPCGRSLPVISRILGRQRNMLTLPDGGHRWPSFPSEKWSHIAPIRQLQLVQPAPDRIDINVAAERSLTDQEKKGLVAALQDCLGHPFAMEVRQLPEIPRNAGYKFEDFVSEIV